ncbi:MAG: histone deacetylase family protein [Alphaproteobacteria bacterium]
MTTLLYTHESCMLHDPGPTHPESPDRLRAVIRALDVPDFAALDRRKAPRAELDQIARVHPRDYIDAALAAVPADGLAYLDPDTALSPQSGEAALRASGALCAAVDAVMEGEAANAFCAVRPPGHHAEPARAMGFCIFNHVAVGAEQARAAHGLKRVAVVDFDVHHGNGTQAMFWDDANLLYASTHQFPHYPGSGRREESGVAGNIVNAPLAPNTGGTEFRRAMNALILPALDEFKPEFLLISAGFDAHRDDPLAALNLTEDDFAWVTRELLRVADRHCGGRLVSTLEGGYDLPALGRSAAAHVAALMEA